MTPEDSMTPADRLAPLRPRYPWWVVFVLGILIVFSVSQAITDWGDRVEHTVTLNCGI